jgi:hypothetical protein
MVAGSVVPCIRRTLTDDGDSIANSDEIFVVGWIFLTGIPLLMSLALTGVQAPTLAVTSR